MVPFQSQVCSDQYILIPLQASLNLTRQKDPGHFLSSAYKLSVGNLSKL